jgi:tetratricopeptide (TPR) repeat protein
MRTTLKYLSAACASTMLFACAGLNDRTADLASVVSAASADAAYVSGKQHHLAGRVAQAEAAYWDALRADPRHVNARNGLATIHAERGELARAIPIWRALTENMPAAPGPSAAFLFANLGHAYFLSGDHQGAVAALEKSCLLDPLNHRSWQRLGEALQKLGQEERAMQMFRQAAALRQHDFRADYVAAGATTAVPAIEAAVKAPPRPDLEEWAATEVSVTADGMLELRRIPAASAAIVAAAPEPPPPLRAPLAASAMPAVALLEIRNGNGVTGMARSLSSRMGDPGLKVTRLTNEKGFNVRRTRVEHQAAYREAAERLAQRFGSAEVVEVDNCKSTNMRLIIGRDVARRNFALRPLPGTATGPLVAAVQPTKPAEG